jgi:hypothetical protein
MTESPTPDVPVTLAAAATACAYARAALATASEPTREVPTAPAESERDAEIERLRKAGDALAMLVKRYTPDAAAITAWKAATVSQGSDDDG